MSPEQAISRYACCIPSELESGTDFTAETCTWAAERYGGDGIGLNGGAGRCGGDGHYQIKGIGRTPLVDQRIASSDLWHSHGGVAAPDALQEAAWGEVFSAALPFGAARVAAVVLTGTDCWYEGEGGIVSKAPRALVIRQSAIRPAHFMRAIYFRPDPPTPGSTTDVERVRAGMAQLHTLLPQRHAVPSAGKDDLIVNGLREMASRWAQQCAASQVGKLLHGALFPSNLSIDGRWLDFGTASSLATHANMKVRGAPSHFTTLWEEQVQLERVIGEFLFYVRKYAPCDHARAERFEHWLVGEYRRDYAQALRLAVLKGLGLPRAILHATWAHPASQALASGLIQTMLRGNEVRTEPATWNYPAYGHNRLGQVIKALAASAGGTRHGPELSGLVPDSRDRTALVTSFDDFLHAAMGCAAGAGLSLRACVRFCRMGGAKLAAVLPDLFRHRLAACARDIVFNSKRSELAALFTRRITDIASVARVVYSPVEGMRTLLWELLTAASTTTVRSTVGF